MKNKHTLQHSVTYYNMLIKIFLISLHFLFANISFSQIVEIIRKSDLKNLPEQKAFAFIEPSTDTSKIKFVATILARDKDFKKSNIEHLFFSIREKANSLGANCYKVKSFTRGGAKNEAILILDIYVASDSLLDQNSNNHEKNAVFVFGGEKIDNKKTYSFNINGIQKELKSGTYYKYVLKEGEELKLNKGGVVGMTVWLKWAKDKQPVFFTLSGFGLSDWDKQPNNGISFNAGKLNSINNIGFGLLLTQLLKQDN